MIVLVTGATAGLGAAITKRFVAAGDRVIAVGRRIDRLDALRAELGEEAVHTIALDVRKRVDVAAAVANLPQAFENVDVLVNNAGLAIGLAPAQHANLDDWDRMIETNVVGLTYVTHAVLPGMVERRRRHIINLGSIAATYPYPGGNVYGATKAFVRQFSLNLRADLAGTKVRVTDIEPGMVGGSEFSLVRFDGDAEQVAKLYAGADPLTPEDIADTAYWVASRPPRVNVNTIELMPVSQSFGSLPIYREESTG